ncbi:MAG TPA: methionyl-tRNA formyltransferase [Acidimicrobiales bacterium]|nr:methionyl-tRNA formyltransferase [Acidimicrobiales bacterium]
MAFLGSPEPAARCLQALVDAGHDIVLVVSEPDKRRARGSATSPTPVKALARELGIAVSDRVDDVLTVGAEVGVVVAFGRLIRPAVLEHLEMVNVHFSLLPRWRGAAPVERAILAGDERTGVCLMRLEEGLDTGPVYACAETDIGPRETVSVLRLRLSRLGAELLVSRLAGGVHTLGQPAPQVGEATYAAKITQEDLHIDWSRPAVAIERQVRVGRAWTTFRHARVIVWAAEARGGGPPQDAGPAPGTIAGRLVATGDGWLELSVVQAAGRQRQSVTDWLRGARISPGEAFD